jgi:Domain of unknown function (DUF4394)/Calx-beta domain
MRTRWPYRIAPALLLALALAPSARAEPITGLTTTNGLFTFDSATPGTISAATPVTGLDAGDSLISIDRNPNDGVLYGLGRDSATSDTRVYRIAATGAATTVGPVFSTPLTTSNADLDFEPIFTSGVARIVTSTDQNIQWFSQDGSIQVQTALDYPPLDPRGAVDPTGVGLAHTQNYPGGQAGTAYVYDWSSPDALAILGTAGQPFSSSNGQLSTVGNTGVSAGSVVNVGLDVAPGGTMYALLRVSNITRLYTINASTGLASLVGQLNDGSDTVRDIATSPVQNTFSFSAAFYAAGESDGKLSVTIDRSQAFGAASVHLTSADASATSSTFTDYKSVDTTVLFANGEASKTVDIEIRSDLVDEASETFTLALSQPSGGVAAVTAPSTAVGQIDDDDSGPAPSARLTALTTTNELVSFDTGSPGTVSAALPISGLAAGEALVGIDRRPATGRLYALSNQSRLYLIDESTGAASQVGSGQFAPPLTGLGWGFDFSPTADRIRVISRGGGQNLRINPDTAEVVVDAQTVYAAGDQFQAQTVGGAALAYANNVPAAPSTTPYGYDYTKDVLFRLGSPGGSPVSPNSGIAYSIGSRTIVAQNAENVGLDIAPDGNAWALIRDSGVTRLNRFDLATGVPALVGTVGNGNDTIRDIAALPVSNTIQLSANAYSGGEAGGSVTVTAVRNQTRGAATVNLATSDGSAAAGSDYTPSSGTVTFADGEASKDVPILVSDDGSIEGAETFTVTLSSPGGGVASLGDPTAATVTLSDNDSKPAVTACGRRSQDIAKRGRVSVCFKSNKNGEADAAGKVKIEGSRRSYKLARVTRSVSNGVKRTINLRLSRKALTAVRAAVERRKTVTVTITLRVRDTAGNQTVKKRKISAKLPARRR